MQKLLEEAKRLGVAVYFVELKKAGYSIIEAKAIFINQNLSDDQTKKALLHELAHFKMHADLLPLYDKSTPHSKMENEANMAMINEIIEEHEGEYNYSQVLEEFNLRIGYDVKFAK